MTTMHQFPSYRIADFLPGKHPDTGFHINRLEEIPPLPAQIVSPHKHRFHEVFLMKKGQAFHHVDYQSFELRDYSLFFISEGQLHFWTRANGPISGYRLMFTETFFEHGQANRHFLFELIYLHNIYLKPYLELSAADCEPLFTYFELLLAESARPDCTQAIQCAQLFLLLSELQRLFAKQRATMAPPTQMVVFKQFVQLMENRLCEKWSAGDYARALYMSPKHLNRTISAVTGKSVTEVIQERTALEAKRLLTFSDLSVSQIAMQLGFEDASYFARFFRKMVGQAPVDFSARMSEKYQDSFQ